MHGAATSLPNKISFFKKTCLELKSDVISFAYRGFTQSDGARACTRGIAKDIEAISKFFSETVEAESENYQVETILWGKSFGCSTAILAKLAKPELHQILILESPFTSV